MKHGIDNLLVQLREGNELSCLLLHGDDFQVHEAMKSILDLVAPAEQRSLILERFDGRTTRWVEIEASLMTPPLFAAKKTVLLEDVPYFLSREHKADLRERVVKLWREGKEEEAARQFLDLLLSIGWTQETWEQLGTPLRAHELEDLFGNDGEELRDEAEALVAFCRARGWAPTQQGSGEGQRLMELLEHGLPPWALLLMTAAQVDRRSRLYKRFADKGAALDLAVAKEKNGRISRETLRDFLRRQLEEANKKIEAEAHELILARAGDELWSVHNEVEKLLLYVGDAPTIRARDVTEVFLDLGEGYIFDLTKAIAERDARAALEHLERLLSQGDHPLRLLAVIASNVRRILAARQLIETDFRQSWRPEMSLEQFQRSVLKQGPALLTRSPYGDYQTFKSADRFTTGGLVGILERIYEADVRLKSSSHPPRLVLERLVLEMCRG
jgi:DNA polymerase III subunit delta